MDRPIKLAATWLVLSAMRAIAQNTTATTLVVGSGGEFQVSEYGKATISTTQAGPLLHVHQAGGGYGSGSTNAALILSTDGVGGNYLLSGRTTDAVNFFFRADGHAYFGGNVGIGTENPAAQVHVVASSLTEYAGGGTSPIGSGLVLQGTDTGRTVGKGPSLTFMMPANTDGSNPWEQARILASPDNSNTADASGRLYLQVRSSYDPGIGGTWNWRTGLMIQSNGNTGIGTTAPGAKLEVNGNLKLTNGSGASLTFSDGTTQSTAWTGTLCGGDYAESVDAAGDRALYQPGDVLVISDDEAADVRRSRLPYSTMVSGIYSTKPGMVGRRQQTKDNSPELPMAMIGIVPTKVIAENGPIRRGDLLVTSSSEGYAMKGTDHARMLGAVIGKALGELDSGTGMIEVLVTLQ